MAAIVCACYVAYRPVSVVSPIVKDTTARGIAFRKDYDRKNGEVSEVTLEKYDTMYTFNLNPSLHPEWKSSVEQIAFHAMFDWTTNSVQLDAAKRGALIALGCIWGNDSLACSLRAQNPFYYQNSVSKIASPSLKEAIKEDALKHLSEIDLATILVIDSNLAMDCIKKMSDSLLVDYVDMCWTAPALDSVVLSAIAAKISDRSLMYLVFEKGGRIVKYIPECRRRLVLSGLGKHNASHLWFMIQYGKVDADWFTNEQGRIFIQKVKTDGTLDFYRLREIYWSNKFISQKEFLSILGSRDMNFLVQALNDFERERDCLFIDNALHMALIEKAKTKEDVKFLAGYFAKRNEVAYLTLLLHKF